MFESGVVIAVIVAVGQLAKRYMNAKYVPVVTMILGIIGGYVVLASRNYSGCCYEWDYVRPDL